MTVRECFNACLTELNKVQAPALLLDDFVYLFNKCVQKYQNKKYNQFEVNQQLTDDLRVLMRTRALDPVRVTEGSTARENIFGESYTVELPDDYYHILNCICDFKRINQSNKCGKQESDFQVGANKLDTSQWSSIITNYYMKPSVKRPYYYISNALTEDKEYEQVNNAPKDKQEGVRYGNRTVPTMEIKCGNENNKYKLKKVYIDYLIAPEYIKITQDQLDSPEDNTKLLEFPDYVIYEIINEFVQTVLENNSNIQRTQTFTPANTSIAPQQTVSK